MIKATRADILSSTKQMAETIESHKQDGDFRQWTRLYLTCMLTSIVQTALHQRLPDDSPVQKDLRQPIEGEIVDSITSSGTQPPNTERVNEIDDLNKSIFYFVKSLLVDPTTETDGSIRMLISAMTQQLRARQEKPYKLQVKYEAVLQEAKTWAMEAKTQRGTIHEICSILGGLPDWGPIVETLKQKLDKPTLDIEAAMKLIHRKSFVVKSQDYGREVIFPDHVRAILENATDTPPDKEEKE